jgi:hypothetical protein
MYLYVKTHNTTGLKYLGKTTKKDPHKYPGSGTVWRRHLDKHGYDYSTEILLETDDKSKIKDAGIYYSNLWNVVNSKEWANLKPETGDGGDMSMCQAWQEAMLKQEKRTGEKNPMFNTPCYYKMSDQEIANWKDNIRKSTLGKPKPKTSEGLRKRWETQEHFNKGKEPWNKGKTGVQQTYGVEHALVHSKPCRYNGEVYHGIHACAKANNTTKYKIEKLVEFITVDEYRSLQPK